MRAPTTATMPSRPYRGLVDLHRSGRLGPMPTRVISLDEVAEALAALAERSAMGKTVVRNAPVGATGDGPT